MTIADPNGPAPTPPASPAPAPPTPPAPTPDPSGGPGGISQEQMNAIAAREKAEGKAQAERELAAKLGVTPDEAAAIIKAHKDAETAALSDAEKAKQAAEQAQAAAAADRAAAARDRREAALERSLTAAGCGAFEEDADKRAKVLARALGTVTIPDDTKPDDLQTVIDGEVAKLKAEVPVLFAASTPAGPTPPAPPAPRPPGSTPAGGPPPPRPPAGGLAAGFARGQQAGGSGQRRSWVDPANAPAPAPAQ